ncbi:MAG TPA: xanthine dehydrogenase family protein subunit M [Pyrinomonadaceae bacterium]|nr:xanthine dehydrogenase family protein subunit M [Pyrinomonadaceae bacterium]
MKNFEWAEAGSVAEGLALMRAGAAYKAGGLDLLDRMKEGLDAPARLVNIRNVKELEGVAATAGGGLRIGPLVTLAALDTDEIVRGRYAALSEAAGHAATPQIRNVATLGGNLLQRPRCWYFRSEDFHCRKKGGDTCFALEGENQYHAVFSNRVCAIVHPSATAVALVALGARVELAGAKGRREVLLEEFFVAPEEDVTRENKLGDGELMTAVILPPTSSSTRSAYLKLGEKESFDWPLAEVAAVLEMEGGGRCRRASVVLGAAAPVPLRARGAEEALKGRVIDEASARAAAEAAMKGATPLAENAYKLPIFKTLVRRAVVAAATA